LDFGLSTLDFGLWTSDFGLSTLDFGLWTLNKKLRPDDPKIAGALYRPNYWRRAAPQQQRTIP
jgi:hypothetical protein